MSERLAKCCTGTPAIAHRLEKTAQETASVVYFWLALCLMTTPPFMNVRFCASYFSGWFGWTACALSAEAMKLAAMAARISPSVAPSAAPARVSTSVRNVESAPCLEPLPTSSLSSTASTLMWPTASLARNAAAEV